MQLPRTASSVFQQEMPTFSLSTRGVSSSGRLYSAFRAPVTNIAQLPQRRQCRRTEVQASLKLEHAHHILTRERAESEDGRPEPALLAEGPRQFDDLEQFYHVLKLSVQLSTPPPRSSQTPGGGNGKNDDFYANVGNAIRTLREEIPLLFQQDFTCKRSSTHLVWLHLASY